MSDESTDPFEGTSYRALERIGAGGMGEVYVVEHRELGTEMVAKLLRSDSPRSDFPALVERLRLEARALAAVNHPNIVRVIHYDVTRDQQPFLVLERLRGMTLAEELRARGRPSIEQALRDMIQVLNALDAAHAKELVHRDIKLSNVFVHREGGQRQVKLLDFGIVKTLGAIRPLAAPTEPGVAIGTLRFMSPEQARGKPVDARSDLYSVGLVLYRLVTGCDPWHGIRGEARIIHAQISLTPEPPSRFAPEIPVQLERAILRALEKAPCDRFESARAFASELESVLQRLAIRGEVDKQPPDPTSEVTAPTVSAGRNALPALADDTLPLGTPMQEGGVRLLGAHAARATPSVNQERYVLTIAILVMFLVGVAVASGVLVGASWSGGD